MSDLYIKDIILLADKVNIGLLRPLSTRKKHKEVYSTPPLSLRLEERLINK